MAEQTQGSSPDQQDKERRAEAKAHAASRVKEEMAAKTRDVTPSSEAALRFQRQKDGRKSPLTLEEREEVMTERAMTISPRSSILKMIAA
jgi:hypothetical protein